MSTRHKKKRNIMSRIRIPIPLCGIVLAILMYTVPKRILHLTFIALVLMGLLMIMGFTIYQFKD